MSNASAKSSFSFRTDSFFVKDPYTLRQSPSKNSIQSVPPSSSMDTTTQGLSQAALPHPDLLSAPAIDFTDPANKTSENPKVPVFPPLVSSLLPGSTATPYSRKTSIPSLDSFFQTSQSILPTGPSIRSNTSSNAISSLYPASFPAPPNILGFTAPVVITPTSSYNNLSSLGMLNNVAKPPAEPPTGHSTILFNRFAPNTNASASTSSSSSQTVSRDTLAQPSIPLTGPFTAATSSTPTPAPNTLTAPAIAIPNYSHGALSSFLNSNTNSPDLLPMPRRISGSPDALAGVNPAHAAAATGTGAFTTGALPPPAALDVSGQSGKALSFGKATPVNQASVDSLTREGRDASGNASASTSGALHLSPSRQSGPSHSSLMSAQNQNTNQKSQSMHKTPSTFALHRFDALNNATNNNIPTPTAGYVNNVLVSPSETSMPTLTSLPSALSLTNAMHGSPSNVRSGFGNSSNFPASGYGFPNYRSNTGLPREPSLTDLISSNVVNPSSRLYGAAAQGLTGAMFGLPAEDVKLHPVNSDSNLLSLSRLSIPKSGNLSTTLGAVATVQTPQITNSASNSNSQGLLNTTQNQPHGFALSSGSALTSNFSSNSLSSLFNPTANPLQSGNLSTLLQQASNGGSSLMRVTSSVNVAANINTLTSVNGSVGLPHNTSSGLLTNMLNNTGNADFGSGNVGSTSIGSGLNTLGSANFPNQANIHAHSALNSLTNSPYLLQSGNTSPLRGDSGYSLSHGFAVQDSPADHFNKRVRKRKETDVYPGIIPSAAIIPEEPLINPPKRRGRPPGSGTGSKRGRKADDKGKKSRKQTPVCTICGKVFRDKYYLDRHLVTHTGEKAHECASCSLKFTQEGHLTRHIKTIHSATYQAQCHACLAVFQHPRILNERYVDCPRCGAVIQSHNALLMYNNSQLSGNRKNEASQSGAVATHNYQHSVRGDGSEEEDVESDVSEEE